MQRYRQVFSARAGVNMLSHQLQQDTGIQNLSKRSDSVLQ